jgi:hypothetical protein
VAAAKEALLVNLLLQAIVNLLQQIEVAAEVQLIEDQVQAALEVMAVKEL